MTMQLIATIVGIGMLTAMAWGLRRFLFPRLCPLCAGVAGTWIAMLAAHWAGMELDLRLPALLLGGSVVGLAGLGEVALAGRAPGAVLAWKTAFVATGFATAYALLLAAWLPAGLGGALLAALLGLPWAVAARRSGAGPTAGPTAGQRRVLSELRNCC
jgi:hypothetical protein